MAGTVRLKDTVDAGLVEAVDALAQATGRRRGEIIEQALRLILDPLPALMHARETVTAYRQEMQVVRDQIQVVADYVVDATREQGDM